MTRIGSFSSPFLLGFDGLERLMERAAKTAHDGYPPYNIERIASQGQGAELLRITLAVAGFRQDELDITLEDNQLVVRGRQADDSEGREFLHRGIAARQFSRAFVLADHIEIEGAHLADGLLSIDLRREEPQKLVRKVEISTNR
ncbi:MAG: Hsp20 family protein [Hyphomicrobiaceae bacterium]|nr:Hsp20 family protein [Hyphomicrobiaceae bacterium]